MNVDILNSFFAEKFEELLQGIIENDCRQIKFEDYGRRKSWVSSALNWFSYQMIRFMMRMMFILTSKKTKPQTTYKT
jgi:hypothetical protein